MDPLSLEAVARMAGGRLEPRRTRGRIATVVTDGRSAGPGALFVALRAGRDGHAFVTQARERGAPCVLVDRPAPGGPMIIVEDTMEALTRMAGAWRGRLRARVAAVTGSNGKTTTKDLLARILSRHGRTAKAPGSFNNHLGVPLTILGAGSDCEFLVVEVGASAPGEVGRLAALAAPDVAVITNVGPAHLAGFGDLEGVARAKGEMALVPPADGWLVVNGDDPRCRAIARGSSRRVVHFGTGAGNEVRGLDPRRTQRGTVFRVEGGPEVELPFGGLHNAWNALAALATAQCLGVAPAEAALALEGAAPPPQRLAVRRAGGVTILDDTWNANPASARAALEDLAARRRGRTVAVLGEMAELGGHAAWYHRELGAEAARLGVNRLVAVGPYADEVAAGALEAGMAPRRVRALSDAAGVGAALATVARAGDTVLFKASRSCRFERVAGEYADAVAWRAELERVHRRRAAGWNRAT
ncbi:MAG: UDP-N-acetylmuramoyl-tripeptide--D-alanyl-D-alanine ligase [Planctomycetes bacterium]|nr:UDP-N-acetylmuramoyl-tripeptide--D-alanyl-D-alanine ligase [Planctomycetota bacterium]